MATNLPVYWQYKCQTIQILANISIQFPQPDFHSFRNWASSPIFTNLKMRSPYISSKSMDYEENNLCL